MTQIMNQTPTVRSGGDGGCLIVPKNAQDEVRITLTDYKGYAIVDIRVFSDFAGDGVRRPTKKGVALRVGTLPDLISALQQVAVQAGVV